ncbi:unnamed protein product, partial [Rhizoctonia solani]
MSDLKRLAQTRLLNDATDLPTVSEDVTNAAGSRKELRSAQNRINEGEEHDREEEERVPKIGTPEFNAYLHDAIEQPTMCINEWFGLVGKANCWDHHIDTASALLSIAPGMRMVSDAEIAFILPHLPAENLDVPTAVLREIETIQPKDLYEYFEVARELNQLPKTGLRLHIVRSIYTLKSAIGRRLLEDQTNKYEVTRQVYKAMREEQGFKAVFGSKNFKWFHKAFNDYNDGCDRFLYAYRQIGSILLRCPQLRIQRFRDTILGAILSEAVDYLVVPDSEAARREEIHRNLLVA